MRKAIRDNLTAATLFSLESLKLLEEKGYKFVQVKGITLDNHYDYIEPHHLILIPIKELPKDPAEKDIYESVTSEFLRQWAEEPNQAMLIYIAG